MTTPLVQERRAAPRGWGVLRSPLGAGTAASNLSHCGKEQPSPTHAKVITAQLQMIVGRLCLRDDNLPGEKREGAGPNFQGGSRFCILRETTLAPLSIPAIPTPGFEPAARSGTEESPDPAPVPVGTTWSRSVTRGSAASPGCSAGWDVSSLAHSFCLTPLAAAGQEGNRTVKPLFSIREALSHFPASS